MIREHMEALHWAAPALAKASGVSYGRVQAVLRGYHTPEGGQPKATKLSATALARVCQALQIDPEEVREAGRIDAGDLMDALPVLYQISTNDLRIELTRRGYGLSELALVPTHDLFRELQERADR